MIVSKAIDEKGSAKIKILVSNNGKNYYFELHQKRKFDYNTFKTLKKEAYIKKINF